MAEKIIIAEIDIDLSKATKDTIAYKEEVQKLTAQTKKAKEEQGELSEEYVQYSAALKSAQADLKAQEQLMQKITTANNAQTGSIEQLRAQLGVVTKQWAQLSEEERLSTQEGIKLTQQKLELTEALKKEEMATGDSRRGVGEYERASVSLRTELKAIVLEMGQLAMAGDESSERFKELSERGGRVKDTLGDISARLKLVGSDTKNIDMVVGSFMALGSVVQAAEGSMALFGAENEDVTKSIQKMVAIQSIMTGVQEFANSLQKESAFMMSLVAVKTAVATAAQKTYTWAISGTTLASKALRVALLGTGIGAVVIGLGFLVKYVIELNQETESAIDKNKRLNEEYADQIDNRQKQYDLEKKLNDQSTANANTMISYNEKIGKSETELAKLREQVAASNALTADSQYNKLVKQYGSIESLKEEAIRTEEVYAKKKKKLAQDDSEAAKAQIETAKTAAENAVKTRDLLLTAEKDASEASNALLLAGADVQAAISKQAEDNSKRRAEERKKKAEDDKKAAEDALKYFEAELEGWKLVNKSKLDDTKDLNAKLVQEEVRRINENLKKAQEVNEFAFNMNVISEQQYNLKELELTTQAEEDKAAIQRKYDEQQKAYKLEAQVTDYENERILAEGHIDEMARLQIEGLERQKEEEIRTAEKTGASIDLINKKYAAAEVKIESEKQKTKWSIASQFAGNLAVLFGESTKLGKSAAIAQTTIDTLQSSIGAFKAAQSLSYPYNLIVGGVSAAAALAQGYATVKKIAAVNPTSESGQSLNSSGGVSASSVSTSAGSDTGTTQLDSANAEVGTGIVLRQLQEQTNKSRVAVVIDEVTKAQNLQGFASASSKI